MSKEGCRPRAGIEPEERYFDASGGGFRGFHPFAGGSDVTAEARKATMKLTKTPYVEEYYEEERQHFMRDSSVPALRWGPRYRLTEAGRAIALGPEPAFKYPAPPRIGELEVALLGHLGDRPEKWGTPLRWSGMGGSSASNALYKLTLNGLAKMQKSWGSTVSGLEAFPKPQIFPRAKGSRQFKITSAGLAFLREREGPSVPDHH